MTLKLVEITKTHLSHPKHGEALQSMLAQARENNPAFPSITQTNTPGNDKTLSHFEAGCQPTHFFGLYDAETAPEALPLAIIKVEIQRSKYKDNRSAIYRAVNQSEGRSLSSSSSEMKELAKQFNDTNIFEIKEFHNTSGLATNGSNSIDDTTLITAANDSFRDYCSSLRNVFPLIYTHKETNITQSTDHLPPQTPTSAASSGWATQLLASTSAHPSKRGRH